MEKSNEKVRPNIRIQIQNNLPETENMEVENEDGELIESDEKIEENKIVQNSSLNLRDKVPTITNVFTTGINIFDKEEQQKLQERARRFALKPEEIHSFTDADLSELYESLGITSDNQASIRFEAVHVLGISEMSVEDLLEYFVSYAPAEIEWVDSNSCNITWVENISAARAIFYNSNAVMGMPAREPVDIFGEEFLIDVEEPSTGKSILLKNREVEVKIEDILIQNKPNLKNAVDISAIKIAVPPGFWRLGKDHPKAKCLLLRFALKTDKKPFRVENLGKYYKKLGSKILISENRKKDWNGIFERNRDLNSGKNPWGCIAKNWDEDVKFREPEPEHNQMIESVSPSLQVRLGKKKNQEQQIDSVMQAKEECTDKVIRSKTRIPRMRMYADEEEEKLRRKKLLQTLKHHTESFSYKSLETTDLRNILCLSNKLPQEIIEIDSGSDETDLGSKLKSRTKQMVYTVESNGANTYFKENRRRTSSPLYRKRITLPRISPERRAYRKRSRSPVTRYKSPVRRGLISDRSSRHKKSSVTLRSDQFITRYKRRRRDSAYSDDGFNSHKPKSRVAIVLKKPKKPTVASTIWSRVQYVSETDSSSRSRSSESEESNSSSSRSSSEESETESESVSESEEPSDSSSYSKRRVRSVIRPGFQGGTLLQKVNHRTPLKITMSNDKIRK